MAIEAVERAHSTTQHRVRGSERHAETQSLPFLLWPLAVLLAGSLASCSLQQKLEREPRLAHFVSEAPEVGAFLPPVMVFDLEGKAVELSALPFLSSGGMESSGGVGRPVVLQLGSHTCPVYRYRRFGMDGLVGEFGDRVDFYLLYSLEAHPVESPSPYTDQEWDVWINRLVHVRLGQTEGLEERLERARWSVGRLEIDRRVLVDGPENAAWRALGRAPAPLYVIAADGRIVARQMWLHPPTLRKILNESLTM